MRYAVFSLRRVLELTNPQLYNMQPDAESANYDLSVLRDFREKRFNESIAGNPDFFCKIMLTIMRIPFTTNKDLAIRCPV